MVGYVSSLVNSCFLLSFPLTINKEKLFICQKVLLF